MVKIYDDGNLFCKKIPNNRCSYAFVNLEDTAKTHVSAISYNTLPVEEIFHDKCFVHLMT